MTTTPTEVLDAAVLRTVVSRYHEVLGAHREALNRLNVYPVPDGDTGINMELTVDAACRELERADGAMAETCRAIAHGSLMGARGNSGVILCQILRGLADELGGAARADGVALATALSAASDAAYGAVGRPVEGTILTVVREAAAGAREAADAGGDLRAVVDRAHRSAADALERTPELLPVLAEAGVVDAGGAGLVLLFDAMRAVLGGHPLPPPPDLGDVTPEGRAPVAAASAAQPCGHDDVSELRYEVMYFLEAPDEAIAAFKDLWATIGDSIVVVGGDGVYNCHIHTNDIGAAVEAGIDVGRPRQIRVTDLAEQVEEERWVAEADPARDVPAHLDAPVATAVVAVATGDGIRRIFHSLGVQRVVTGGQTMNPSTAQLLEAVEAAPGDEVVILPNNRNIIAVAEQVDGQSTKAVHVVPTRSVTEGFAALQFYDPHAAGAENRDSMRAAAEGVVAGEITSAVRDSVCDLGPIAEGDWMGLGPGGILAVAPDLATCTESLLDALVTSAHEIVTVVEGEGATAAATRRIELWLAEHHPDVVAEVHHGGQPLYPYLFGIE